MDALKKVQPPPLEEWMPYAALQRPCVDGSKSPQVKCPMECSILVRVEIPARIVETRQKMRCKGQNGPWQNRGEQNLAIEILESCVARRQNRPTDIRHFTREAIGCSLLYSDDKRRTARDVPWHCVGLKRMLVVNFEGFAIAGPCHDVRFSNPLCIVQYMKQFGWKQQPGNIFFLFLRHGGWWQLFSWPQDNVLPLLSSSTAAGADWRKRVILSKRLNLTVTTL